MIFDALLFIVGLAIAFVLLPLALIVMLLVLIGLPIVLLFRSFRRLLRG